jgi:choline dehydrogenase-like flavoprotein
MTRDVALHGYSHASPPPGVFSRNDLPASTVLGCDVVIVGSGAGGATAAAELAEAGFDVVVLEEGSYHGTQDFTTRATAMIRRMYRDAGASAAIGTPPILFQEGRTVGGSSVVNGAMSWRTPEHVLARWFAEDKLPGLDPKSMEPFFERVERRIHVAHNDPEVIGRDNQLLKEGADAKGWRVVPNLRNQLHCAGSNNCAFGCPTGAKQSTLVTYIPRALHFGARIYSNIRVDRITWAGKRATGIEGHVVLADGSRGPRVAVRAKLTIVACGSIQTPALLARSKFRSPSGELGKNLAMHPNVKVVAIFDEDVRGWEGVHQAYQVREFKNDGIVTMAAVNVPPSILALTLPHYGAALGELMADYKRAVVAGLVCEDTARGRVRIAPGGKPVAFYNIADVDIERIKRGTALLCELLFAAGARRIILPFSGVADLCSADETSRIFETRIAKSGIEVVTVHLMGTARMGGDRTAAVTDGFGRVYDADRLFVCDASLFPSPTGVNPAETIQALSTRNAAHIIENRGRYLA